MSGYTTPDCGSEYDFHDNDNQSERSVHSQNILLTSDDNEIDNESSTVLARCGSECGRVNFAEVAGDLEHPLYSRRADPGIDFLHETGTWAPQNPGTDLPRHRGVIPQELSLEDDPLDTHAQRRLREEEGPWSLLDPTIVANNRISVTWISRIYQPQLIKHTKRAVQQFLNSDVVVCAGDIERTWMGTPDNHRHARLAFESLLAMIGALAVFALLTLQTYGIEVSFMLIYGLVMVALGVLVVIRMLLA